MRDERGAAVPEFVLVLGILIPLVLGIIQVGLVMHVRNTMTAAASDGAHAGAPLGAGVDEAEQRAQHVMSSTLSDRFTSSIRATQSRHGGVAVVEVRIESEVPALGLFGPAIHLEARGRAVVQEEP